METEPNTKFKSVQFGDSENMSIKAIVPFFQHEGEEVVETEREHLIPVNEGNRFYQELVEWEKIEGNEIAAYVAPMVIEPEPETIPAKLERLTGLSMAELRQALKETP